jgi:AhpD family alkylhydroperoxidase
MHKERTFSVKEFLAICDEAAAAITGSGREMKMIDKNFKSQIMLAVTQVNGCKFCSYVHTKHALKSGSSAEDLARLMEGDLSSVDPVRTPALVFAQHYAHTMGDYDAAAYERIVSSYGADRARGILAIVKKIMMTNAFGGAISLFGDRIKRMKHPESRLVSELGILLGALVFLPLMLIKNALTGRRG